MRISININDEIEFELTKYGERILREFNEKHHINRDNKKMLLWQFIEIFGDEFYMGMSQLVIENNEIFTRIK